jgi:hypothetical protein
MNKIEIAMEIPEFLKGHIELYSSGVIEFPRGVNVGEEFVFVLSSLSAYNFWCAYKQRAIELLSQAVTEAIGRKGVCLRVHCSLIPTGTHVGTAIWIGMTPTEHGITYSHALWKLSKKQVGHKRHFIWDNER